MTKFGSACVIFLVLAGCSAVDPGSAPPSARAAQGTFHASWAEYFDTIGGLRDASLFAVHAVATRAEALPYDPETKIPFTLVTFSTKESLFAKGGAHAPSTFTIKQVGGLADGVQMAVEDDPMYAVGDEVVLFLKEWAPGQYKVSGGPSGRFVVEKNNVRPIVGNGVAVPKGTPVDRLLALN